jgi:hypothetical protein
MGVLGVLVEIVQPNLLFNTRKVFETEKLARVEELPMEGLRRPWKGGL